MTKGEGTRQAIIERAAPLFNQRGFHGCSMSDIMSATGLRKGGVYRHFSSKEELAQAVFQYSSQASLKLRAVSLEEAGSPLEALRTLIRRFVHEPSAVPGGCPLLNAAVDTDDGNEAVRLLVREAFRKWRERIALLAQKAKDAGEISGTTDVRWLGNTIIGTLEGAVMLSRLERNKEPLQHAQLTLELVLHSLTQGKRPTRQRAVTRRTSRKGSEASSV